jgi:hypothetical protein
MTIDAARLRAGVDVKPAPAVMFPNNSGMGGNIES